MGQKKTILKLLFIFFALQSCISQEVDLLEINFPAEKTKYFSEKDNSEKENFSFDQSLNAYKFIESSKFNVGENNIFKSIDGNSATYSGQNYVQLLMDQKDKIQGYVVHSYIKEESEKILFSLSKKLGKPNYDDADKVDRHIVWETANATYIFNISYQVKINGVKTVEANLYTLNNKLEKLIFYLNSTSHYESYLIERKKQNKSRSNFSYSEFAAQKKQDGAEYYQKGIQGLK